MTKEKKIKTVTVGIPAYNEEANIAKLLCSVSRQKEEGFFIEKILVISDGSSDKTAEKVKKCEDPRITLISEKERAGKPARLNRIFSETQSDIVVILDADIRLAGEETIKKLVEPLINGSGAESASGFAVPLIPRTIIQKIAMAGVDIWDKARKSKYSSPLYLSEGRIRAFTKKVYREMRFPQASADEAFSFLHCAAKKQPFVFIEEALVYYNLPETFSDYLKQNKRFIKSKGIQESAYGKKFVAEYYTLGFKAKFIFLLKAMAKNPFWTLLYLSFIPLIRISFIMDKSNQEAVWEAITTSKILKYEERRRKIFFSTYDSIGNPYYGGGGAFAIHEVAKRLADKYSVTILCGRYPFAKDGTIDNVSYKYIGFDFFGPRFGQLVYHLALPYYAAKNKFDIWVESFTPPFSSSFLPFFAKKPVIGLVHMLSAEDMLRKYKISFYPIERLGIKSYRYFIFLTEEIAEKIKKINPRAKSEIIPNGVNKVFFGNIAARKKHFLYIGRIEINQKGLDLLLDAYKLIADKVEYPLVIAGRGAAQEEAKLKKLIKRLEISDKVKLAGRVEGRKKFRMFKEAAAVIIPSRFETFPLVALEALAHGVPEIVFDIGGLKWLPRKFSCKIKPFDVSALALAMRQSAEEKGQEKINFREVEIFLKDYDWEIIAGRFEKYFNSIIKL